MQLTIDSTEPLDHVLRVVESLYGVQLSATTKSSADKPARSAGAGSAQSRRSGAARKTTASPARSASRNAAKTDPAIIRSWARANGHAISDRGRVPAAVLAAYKSSSKTTK
jgi:hypothetical protein